MMDKRWQPMGLFLAALVTGAAAPETPFVKGQSPLAVGEYLVAIGGCNDCHTPGWNQNPGNVPVALRLTGSPVGWSGPWGTSYPSNLRLFVQTMTADQWVKYVSTTESRPPMPWFNVRSMSDADKRAMYAYIRSLGPAGEPAPKALAPGEKPKTPVIEAVPHPPN